ncbi:MAG TPA: NAD-dependent epimerase/dehydratase family protein, partial [Actinomycetota bacterium]|nr:NAD-dependent epimerase/dehydratase family protein [Actinomycetota bacterium]
MARAIEGNDGEDCPIGSYWHDRRVAVAGGSGFIGSYVVDELLGAGADVTIADIAPPHGSAASVRYLEVDLRQLDPCVAALRDVDVVLNLAGKIHGVGHSNS